MIRNADPNVTSRIPSALSAEAQARVDRFAKAAKELVSAVQELCAGPDETFDSAMAELERRIDRAFQ